jgi:hypothetical protein
MDKVDQAGRNVRSKIDESRTPAADKLECAASALHRKAETLPGGETVARVAHRGANRMQATAEYVREHNVHDMMDDAEACVRRHSGRSLLESAVAGFFISCALRRND